MSRRSQNPVLVLTTLGVYLGLLIVGGAAPQVLAHSATTRNFEISDEIEVKDDLDKKPDEATAVDDGTAETFSAVADAFAEYVLGSYGDTLRFTEETEHPNGDRLSHLSYFTSLSPTVSDYTGSVSWVGEKLDREIEIKYTPAPSDLSGHQFAFPIAPKRSKKPLRPISQSSAVRVEPKNQHLVIVTRLPRAGLDALLAKDAK